MKNFVFFIAAMVALSLASCKPSAPEEEVAEEAPFINPLPGTWKMAYNLPPDSTEMDAPDYTQYKFYTDRYFYFVAYDEEADTAVIAGGGTYEVTRDTLTEHIAYTSWDSTNINLSYSFAYSIAENGTFQQRGVMKATSEEEDDFELAEDYQKAGPTLDSTLAKERPVGLWKAIKVAYGDAEEATPLENGDVLYKLITPTHFYVVTYQEEEGRMRGMVFGTYEMKDGKYVEHVLVSTWDPAMANMEIPFDYTLEEGAFMQSAIVEMEGETGKIEEHFMRVE